MQISANPVGKLNLHQPQYTSLTTIVVRNDTKLHPKKRSQLYNMAMTVSDLSVVAKESVKSLVLLQWLLSIRLSLGVQTVADLVALQSYEKPIKLTF
jgi:hypothetical protein